MLLGRGRDKGQRERWEEKVGKGGGVCGDRGVWGKRLFKEGGNVSCGESSRAWWGQVVIGKWGGVGRECGFDASKMEQRSLRDMLAK